MASSSSTGIPSAGTGATSGNPSTSTTSSSLSITPHTADPMLAPFLAAKFDPTAYLNSILPPLAIPSTQQPILPARHASLADLASQTGGHLARLGAQQSRLVDALTGMADDILRSGSRLAYEVEILRGDAAALEELLASDAVRADRARFVDAADGDSKEKEGEAVTDDGDEAKADQNGDVAVTNGKTTKVSDADMADPAANTNAKITTNGTPAPTTEPLAPAALSRLRTLQAVRNQLGRVIGAFDFALSFPLPPSVLAAQSASSSSFVSVAAPIDPAQEAAGQEALARVRQSIVDHYEPLLGRSTVDATEAAAAIERAETRLAEVRALCEVWRGTAEEKARARVVEGWEKEVAEARVRLVGSTSAAAAGGGDAMGTGSATGRNSTDEGGRPSERDGRRRALSRSASAAGSDAVRSREGSQRRGLFGGLRRLRDEIYLD